MTPLKQVAPQDLVEGRVYSYYKDGRWPLRFVKREGEYLLFTQYGHDVFYAESDGHVRQSIMYDPELHELPDQPKAEPMQTTSDKPKMKSYKVTYSTHPTKGGLPVFSQICTVMDFDNDMTAGQCYNEAISALKEDINEDEYVFVIVDFTPIA
jgi:hypothetical protein